MLCKKCMRQHDIRAKHERLCLLPVRLVAPFLPAGPCTAGGPRPSASQTKPFADARDLAPRSGHNSWHHDSPHASVSPVSDAETKSSGPRFGRKGRDAPRLQQLLRRFLSRSLAICVGMMQADTVAPVQNASNPLAGAWLATTGAAV